MTSTLSGILDGFVIVESDGLPVITLDNQSRFYINATARRLMSVKPYERLAIAYNADTHSLAIIRPSASMSDVEMAHVSTSNYNVDKRYYMSARHFAREYRYVSSSLPVHFVYERGTSDGNTFVFTLRE